MKMIGVDVGGTFTDSVFYDDESGEIRWAKALSSPGRPSDGVMASLAENSVDLGEVGRFVHGVTIGTNAILERRGATVWMLVTRGLKDTLEIARTNRPVLYNIKTLKTPPLVNRRHVFEIDERLLASGDTLSPVNRDEVLKIAKELKLHEPGAVIVCLLHSYANPRHEIEVAEILRAELPGWFICNSAEIAPEIREYERFSTTAINGFIGPIMDHYLTNLETSLRGDGYSSPLFIMISSGGIVTADHARRFPVQTVLSGPAGGVAAAVHIGKLQNYPNLITYDMGGTSTDVCLIENLNAPTTSDQLIEGYPIRTPQIDIATIGAGGGSVAWVDTGNILKVGPHSAGASPGPACYDRGGVEPTVTDANLVLGRLSAETKLGGRLPLRKDKAEAAMSRVREIITSLNDIETAEGIVKIAVTRMVSAIKEISIDRGHDPRDFALLAYGGAGPMHAALIADELEMTRVIIPPSPGNFSAFGALISDIRHDYVRSRRYELGNLDMSLIAADFEEMEAVAKETLVSEGIDASRIRCQRACGMRYVGQSWDLAVRLGDAELERERLEALFHQAHEQRYGYRREADVEIVSVRLAGIGQIEKPKIPEWTRTGSPESALIDRRTVRFDGKDFSTPVYDRAKLPGDHVVPGPGVIEEPGSVTVVPPSWSFEVGSIGEILLARKN